MLGALPPIVVGGDRDLGPGSPAGVVQVFPVVAHSEDQLVGHKPLVHQGQDVHPRDMLKIQKHWDTPIYKTV